jgi:hypothetical protein
VLPEWSRRLHYFSDDGIALWVSPRHLAAYLECVYPLQSREEREAGGMVIGNDLSYGFDTRLHGCIKMIHNIKYDHDNATKKSDEEHQYSVTRSLRQRFFLAGWNISRPLIIPIETNDANGVPNFVRHLCTFPNFWLFVDLYFSDTTIRYSCHAPSHHHNVAACKTFLQFYRSHQMAYVVPSNSRFAYDNMVYLCRAASEDEFYDPHIRSSLVLKDPLYPVEYQDPSVYDHHNLIRGVFDIIEARERKKRNAERHP